QVSEATSMLGQVVTAVNSTTGATVKGIADQVIVSNSTDSTGTATQTVQVDIAGTAVAVGDVTNVGPGSVAAPTPSPSSTPSTSPTSGSSGGAAALFNNLPGTVV